MQFLNLLLFLNGWDKSPFDAYLKSLVLSLAGGKKPSVVSLVSKSPSYKGDAVQFFSANLWRRRPRMVVIFTRVPSVGTSGFGELSFFFGVGIEDLGDLESRSESSPSNHVAPNHSMIERK